MKSVVLLAVLAFGLAACEAPPERYVAADGSVCKRIGYSFQNYWMNEKTSMLCHARTDSRG
jgi:hypothetical protein